LILPAARGILNPNREMEPTISIMKCRLEQFQKFFSPYRDATIYVGFSGGADSTALLLLLDRCAEKFNLKLEAVHFDHGLRSNSAEDARWCENFCAERMLRFRRLNLEVTAHQQSGESLEAAARRCRLAAWREVAGPDSFIALGHHAGDRSENALLRFCRGANASGLTSLRPQQEINGMIFLRPLLEWTRREIEDFLHSVNLKYWRDDATNRDPTYKRNLFRQVILPQIYREMPYAEGGIMRSLQAIEQDAAFIEEAAERQFRRIGGKKYLTVEFIREQHEAVLFRLLRLWLSRQTGVDTIPDYHLASRVIAAARRTDGETRVIPFRRDLQLEIHHGRLSLRRTEQPPEFGMIEWDWRQQEEISYGPHLLRAEFPAADAPSSDYDRFQTRFSADALPEILIVRGWQDGDRMVPAGHRTPVKLKKLFADLKISARDKKHYPVILNPKGEVLWVAGVRQTAVTIPTTGEVVRLRYLLNPEYSESDKESKPDGIPRP